MEDNYSVYNPHNKSEDDLPIIYGFNNGGQNGWYQGELLAEDGTPLGGHVCSSESWTLHDLGILKGSRPDRHALFQSHYPDGYRMDFVPGNLVTTHAGLQVAYKRNLDLPNEVGEEATK